jgi:hypothetical protein
MQPETREIGQESALPDFDIQTLHNRFQSFSHFAQEDGLRCKSGSAMLYSRQGEVLQGQGVRQTQKVV